MSEELRVNSELNEDLKEKFEEIRDYTYENTGKRGKAETVRVAIRIAYKKIKEWEKEERTIVDKKYRKLKREIENTIEGEK